MFEKKKMTITSFFKDVGKLFPFVFWAVYDCLMSLWVKFRREDYIGVYVKPMSPVEKWYVFGDNEISACGYTGSVFIKLYAKKDTSKKVIVDILNHEVLHQVLRKYVGEKTTHALDNIHKFRKGKIEFIE